ncbi:hypothetical protein JCM16814_34540 [Desulfobaculum senezii]
MRELSLNIFPLSGIIQHMLFYDDNCKCHALFFYQGTFELHLSYSFTG